MQKNKLWHTNVIIMLFLIFTLFTGTVTAFAISPPTVSLDNNNDGIADGEYGTIQEAVDNALPGATITASGAEYHENITVDKGKHDITIRSAKGAVNTSVYGGVIEKGYRSEPIFSINAQGVTIDGFTIYPSGWQGIQFNNNLELEQDATTGVVKNNIFTTVERFKDSEIHINMRATGVIHADLVKGGNFIVHNNKIIDKFGNFYLGISIDGVENGNLTITDNKISDCVSGIYIATIGDAAVFKIANNTITNANHGDTGIYLNGISAEMDSAMEEEDIVPAVVEIGPGNEISRFNFGVVLDSDTSGAKVWANIVEDNSYGIAVLGSNNEVLGNYISRNNIEPEYVKKDYASISSDSEPLPGGVIIYGIQAIGNKVHYNDFVNDNGLDYYPEFSMYELSDVVYLAAQNNWWGGAAGPGAEENTVSDSVYYSPWATKAYFTSDSLGLTKGSTGQLVLKADNKTSEGKIAQITVPANTVLYTSSNPAVATVTNAGVVTAVGNGTAVITARFANKPTVQVNVNSGGNSRNNTDNILVNGKDTSGVGTSKTTQQDGKTTTTVTVDQKKLAEQLNTAGNKSVITIPVRNNSDVTVGQLNGQSVKDMEGKEAVLEIKTSTAAYTIPAQQININAVSQLIGKDVALQDIEVQIEIAKAADNTVKVIENTANKDQYSIVVPPVEFKITCSYGDKTVDVSKFNAYVERMIAIPSGVDPSKITTGVVLNPDGTFSHVPTEIVVVDGKYYAKINSLTNSAYTVIWNPKEFTDVSKHWAKKYVNEMGARLVVKGINSTQFAPDRAVTRGEFATIIMRALGLKGDSKSNFKDVKKNDWYYGSLDAANAYGIIGGYTDGSFRADKNITREEAMSILNRAMKVADLDSSVSKSDSATYLAKFKDKNKVSKWAEQAVVSCIKTGVVEGSNSKLAPKNNITRAEASTIVMRLLQKAKLI